MLEWPAAHSLQVQTSMPRQTWVWNQKMVSLPWIGRLENGYCCLVGWLQVTIMLP